jgi:hypothetical protein
MNPKRIDSQFKPSISKRSFLVITILFILFNSSLKAQSITFYSGPSVPYGLFASNDITKKEAGFAKTGYHFSVLLEDLRKARLISPYVQVMYNQNKIDEEPLEKYLMANNKQIQGYDATAPWRQGVAMAGAKVNLFKSGYDLYAKAGIGFGTFNAISSIQYYDSLLVLVRNPAKTNAAAASLGAGFNIYLSPSLTLSSGVDMLYAKPNYGKVSFSDGAGNVIAITNTDEIIPIHIMQWYVGLKFYLEKK